VPGHPIHSVGLAEASRTACRTSPLRSALRFAGVGHVPGFLRDRLGFLSRCAARYGDVVKLKIGEHVYLLSNAQDIKYVLAANPQNYDKTPRLMSKRGKRLSGEGLLTLSGETHLKQRRMMQSSFHHKSVAVFADTMVSTTQEMLAA
jgi:cytochrome P450